MTLGGGYGSRCHSGVAADFWLMLGDARCWLVMRPVLEPPSITNGLRTSSLIPKLLVEGSNPVARSKQIIP